MTEEQKVKLTKFGQQIKELRLNKDLTLKELAYSIDKDPQSISRLEMGKVNPSYLYLLDIAKGLNLSIDELFPKK